MFHANEGGLPLIPLPPVFPGHPALNLGSSSPWGTAGWRGRRTPGASEMPPFCARLSRASFLARLFSETRHGLIEEPASVREFFSFLCFRLFWVPSR